MPEWKKTSISEFLSERNGRYKPNDPRVINLKRLNKIDFSGGMHFSDKPSKTDMIIAKKGDLIISGINVAKGAISVYDGEEDITATIHYSSYQFDENRIDVEYFKRFLRSPKFVQLLKDQVKGGIKTEIKARHLLLLKIDLPDLETQKSIVSFFKNTENKISQLGSEIDHQQNLFKQLRQSILQEAVEGKLTAAWRKEHPELISGENHAERLLEKIKAEKERLAKEGKTKKQKPLPPIRDDEKPFELPDGWLWCRLFEVTSILGDGLHGTPTYSKKGNIFFVNGNNLVNGKIVIKDNTKTTDEREFLKHKQPLMDRTVLVSINGTLGNVAFYNEEKIILGKSACFFNLMIGIDKYYIKRFIESQYFIRYAIYVARETTIKNVSLKSMRLMVIPLPSIPEQQVIAKKVDQLLTKVDSLEAQVKTRQEQAEQLMQAVLREAFDGENDR